MAPKIIKVALACKSWKQLSKIYARDLSRNGFFLKTKKPPALRTTVKIQLSLPSGSAIVLVGVVHKIYGKGEFFGRGPGVDLQLEPIAQSIVWLLESALSSAGLLVRLNKPNSIVEGRRDVDEQENLLPETEPAEGEWLIEENELTQALWRELGALPGLACHHVLGLEEDASESAILEAFTGLEKKYHPKQFEEYDSVEIRELTGEVFQLIERAYHEALAKLANAPKSLTAVEQPYVAKTGEEDNEEDNEEEEQTSIPQDMLPLPPVRKKRESNVPPSSVQAPLDEDLFAEAQRNSNDSPGYALGLRLLEDGQNRHALQLLHTEIRVTPDNLNARAAVELAEGRLALASGDRMLAAQRFELALRLFPTFELALAEINMMREKALLKRRELLQRLKP